MLSSLFKSFREKKSEAEIPTPDLSRVLPHLRKSEHARVETVSPEPGPAPQPDIDEDLFDAEVDAPAVEEPEEAFDATAWIERDVNALNAAFQAYSERPNHQETHRQLFLAAHNLRGAATPYGRPTMERIAGSLCELLEKVDSQEPIIAIVKLHVDAVRASSSLPEGSAQEELSKAVCIALEDQVKARLG